MTLNYYKVYLFLIVSANLMGQVKKIDIIPLPFIASNPTYGFAVGLSSGFNWHMGDVNTTRTSSVMGSVMYTTNQQLLLSLRGNTFLKEDHLILMTDFRYQITSQPTYGLGTGSTQTLQPLLDENLEVSDVHYIPVHQMMEYNYLRLYQTVLKRYKNSHFFLGSGYHLDIFSHINDHLLDLTSSPPQITHHYQYNTLKGFSTEKYTLSGVSLDGMYDSRDNVSNPYSGRYVFGSFRFNAQWMGSVRNSTTLWLEYRDYFNLSQRRPRHMMALWSYGWFLTSGELPYMNLPAIGWDMYSRSGRAYTLGRFRGENLAYSEVEYRFPLQEKQETLGGVLFVNTVSASSHTTNINLFQYFNFAYGAGLRIMINKKNRSNLNIDYARGSNGANGFFLNLNEVF